MVAAAPKCILHFPPELKTGRPLTIEQIELMYNILERWVEIILKNRDCLCSGCVEHTEGDELPDSGGFGEQGDTAPLEIADFCFLHVPDKRPEDWLADENNLDWLEQWATTFLKECGCGPTIVPLPT